MTTIAPAADKDTDRPEWWAGRHDPDWAVIDAELAALGLPPESRPA